MRVDGDRQADVNADSLTLTDIDWVVKISKYNTSQTVKENAAEKIKYKNLFRKKNGGLVPPRVCITIATWRCHEHLANGGTAFIWELCRHWLNRLRQRQLTFVVQAH